MTGPFPVGAGPRLQCLVVADADDVDAWSAGLTAAGWEVVGALVGPDAPALRAALDRRKVHALVVGAPSAPGARWPAAALELAVDRALHALVPTAALPAASGAALARQAARAGAVVLVHGDPAASAGSGIRRITTPEAARAMGAVLRWHVIGSPAADVAPAPAGGAPPVRPLAAAVD